MDIVAITDKGFVMPTGVMMYSVCVNNPDTDITFHVIVDESVEQQERDSLRETIEKTATGVIVRYYQIDSRVSRNFPQNDTRKNITQATYYRLFLTEILPQNLKKVLYLDGDIIVRHSIKLLWETNLFDYAVAAVPDFEESEINKYNRLRYSPKYGYFNAGVLLINLEHWRNNCVLKDFTDFINNHYAYIQCHDQDVLNALFKDRKFTLPIKYNLQGGFLYEQPGYDYWKYKDEVDEAIKDPTIVHYTLGKPWETPASPHPFGSTFFKYQSQTIWKGQRTPDRRPYGERFRKYVGRILRAIGVLPPSMNQRDYIKIAPID